MVKEIVSKKILMRNVEENHKKKKMRWKSKGNGKKGLNNKRESCRRKF